MCTSLARCACAMRWCALNVDALCSLSRCGLQHLIVWALLLFIWCALDPDAMRIVARCWISWLVMDKDWCRSRPRVKQFPDCTLKLRCMGTTANWCKRFSGLIKHCCHLPCSKCLPPLQLRQQQRRLIAMHRSCRYLLRQPCMVHQAPCPQACQQPPIAALAQAPCKGHRPRCVAGWQSPHA